MDEQGFISAEYIFALFMIFIIACSLLFYSSSIIDATVNIENSITHRLILDEVSNVISQVNSTVRDIQSILNYHLIKVILK